MSESIPVMQVKSFIKRTEPVTILPDASLREAARKMADEKVGFLVVVDPDDPKKIVGVISERDIIDAFGYGREDSKVRDVMKTDVISVRYDDTVYKAARLLSENNIRHLVVVDEEGKLKGVLSIKDLAYGEGALFSIIF